MQKKLSIAAIAVIVVLGGLYILTGASPYPASILPNYTPDAKNGKTLVLVGGCISCHAAPKGEKCDDPRTKDRKTLGGGRCLKTKYGTFIVPNISSSSEKGIGSWTKIQFINAMQRGVSLRGREYYPVFPYTSYHNMSVEDVLDIQAYLNTLPPSNVVNKPHDIAFPYSLRRLIGLWKYLKFEEHQPIYRQSIGTSQLDRGRYLVTGPGHCGECHTPRDSMGALRQDLALSGAPAAAGKGWVPNITPHELGIKDWTESQIADLFTTGLKPDFDTIGGDMVAVQMNMKEIGAGDRAAIAHYLKSLKPIKGLSQPAKKKK